MHQINIRPDFWNDGRFLQLKELVGENEALGGVIHAWVLAQGFWIQGKKVVKKLVPIDLWHKCPVRNRMLEVGLAEQRSDGVYVCGIDEMLRWVEHRIRGGVQKSKKRKSASIQQLTPSAPAQIISTPNDMSSNNKIVSPSISISISNSINNNKKDKDFDALYNRYPRKQGKQRGLGICRKQIQTEEDFLALSLAIDRYRDYISVNGVEPRFIKQFSTFMASWRDWLDPNAGKVELPKDPHHRELMSLEDLE